MYDLFESLLLVGSGVASFFADIVYTFFGVFTYTRAYESDSKPLFFFARNKDIRYSNAKAFGVSFGRIRFLILIRLMTLWWSTRRQNDLLSY